LPFHWSRSELEPDDLGQRFDLDVSIHVKVHLVSALVKLVISRYSQAGNRSSSVGSHESSYEGRNKGYGGRDLR
jgi:hypothetical protein